MKKVELNNGVEMPILGFGVFQVIDLVQIASLEGSQPGAVREALLGIPGGLDRIQDIDAQIAALRPR
jgi:hypothetical protein